MTQLFQSVVLVQTRAARFGSGWIVGVVEIQLRDYRIRPGRMEDWIERWRSGVVPLREAAGFHVLGAWVDRTNDRFVWLLGYAGADGFVAADKRYYSSSERASLRPDPAELVEEGHQATVEAVS